MASGKTTPPAPSKVTPGKRAGFYTLVTLVTFLIGLSPVAFNLIVDPYEMNGFESIDKTKEKISEKAHYPLWKVTDFPEQTSDIIILGDSRARASG